MDMPTPTSTQPDAAAPAENLQWTTRLNGEIVERAYTEMFGERYVAYRADWNRAGPGYRPEFPIHLDIEVVDACNLRCQHCFRHEDVEQAMGISMNSGKLFPMDLYARVLEEAKAWGLSSINLGFSGECTVNKNLVKMIDMAADAGIMDIRTVTNGLVLTEKKVDEIIDSQLRFFSISIDAGSPESFKKLKGKDGYDYLRRIVRYASERKKSLGKVFPLLRATFYPSPENAGEQDTFVEEFGPHVDFIDIQEFRDLRKIGTYEMKMDCRMPFQRLAIFANGKVAPCCQFYSKKLEVGDVHQNSLKEIWDGAPIEAIRQELIAGRPNPICEACLESIGNP